MSTGASLPFHRKYRSTSFTTLAGNENVKRGVLETLSKGDFPQVVLLQGPAGCGKTTCARLLAQEYLCENRSATYGACGKCDMCLSLLEFIETGDDGGLYEVTEVDVTDSNKREDVDRLLEEANSASFTGGWKVFILDEAHMLTVQAQNRLLKTLEEPQPKVLMILATTDPDKLLETITSRCQHIWTVTKPTRDEMLPLLERVCREENVGYDAKGLSLICVKGEFAPRKALIKLENVVKQRGSASYAAVKEVLNVIEDSYFFDFYRYLMDEPIDTVRFISFLGRLKSNMNLKDFIEGLIEFTNRGIYIINGADVDALDKSEVDQYKRVFTSFDVASIGFLLSKMLKLKYSKDLETEMLLLAYSGLRGANYAKVPADEDDNPLLADLKITPEAEAASEKKEGNDNHIASITMTEEEKQGFVADLSAPLEITELATLFGGAIVKQDTPLKPKPE